MSKKYVSSNQEAEGQKLQALPSEIQTHKGLSNHEEGAERSFAQRARDMLANGELTNLFSASLNAIADADNDGSGSDDCTTEAARKALFDSILEIVAEGIHFLYETSESYEKDRTPQPARIGLLALALDLGDREILQNLVLLWNFAMDRYEATGSTSEGTPTAH